ncbi:hypothetical protein FH620_27335 [Corallococcus exiguus]|nr:hypothetical protein FH620_27335 [Corallococcus exiguus]
MLKPPSQVGDAKVFRPWGGSIALIVSEDISRQHHAERIRLLDLVLSALASGPGPMLTRWRQLVVEHLEAGHDTVDAEYLELREWKIGVRIVVERL